LAAEQQTPEGPRVELGAATEKELCSPGAVKLIHKQFNELQIANRATLAELQMEKGRNETLTFRAQMSETECAVLRVRLGLTGNRDLIVRLIEVGIVGLLAMALELASSGSWRSFAVSVIVVVVLGIAIGLIQRGHPATGGK